MSEIQRFAPPSSLAGKRPASTVVASSAALAGRTEILVAPYVRRWALVEEALRLERRGEIKVLRRDPVWSHERGQWEMVVRRLRPPAPRWRKPAIIAGTAATLLAMTGWVLSTLSGAALAGLLATVLAAFVGWVWVGFARRRATTVEVSVSVKVKG